MEYLSSRDLEDVSSRQQLDSLINETVNKQFKEQVEDSLESGLTTGKEKDIDGLLDGVTELVSEKFESKQEAIGDELEAIKDTQEKLKNLLDTNSENADELLDHTNELKQYASLYAGLYQEVKQQAYIDFSQIQRGKRANTLHNSIPYVADAYGSFSGVINWLGEKAA